MKAKKPRKRSFFHTPIIVEDYSSNGGAVRLWGGWRYEGKTIKDILSTLPEGKCAVFNRLMSEREMNAWRASAEHLGQSLSIHRLKKDRVTRVAIVKR